LGSSTRNRTLSCFSVLSDFVKLVRGVKDPGRAKTTWISCKVCPMSLSVNAVPRWAPGGLNFSRTGKLALTKVIAGTIVDKNIKQITELNRRFISECVRKFFI
jgi:hypothetical protein